MLPDRTSRAFGDVTATHATTVPQFPLQSVRPTQVEGHLAQIFAPEHFGCRAAGRRRPGYTGVEWSARFVDVRTTTRAGASLGEYKY
jgi:hypothetical protein